MKRLAFVVVLALLMTDQSSAQELEFARPRPNDPTTAAASAGPRAERREELPAPAPSATATTEQPPAAYNVEDSRTVIDWLLNRSSVRGR